MLKIENLTHRFPDGTFGIENVTVNVNKGEFIVLTGKNGSGKTVLAKHCNGLLTPSGGAVFFEDRQVSKNLTWVRQRVGMVFQNPDTQLIGQTVEDDIGFGPRNLRLHVDEIRRRVETVLEKTGLASLRYSRPHTLSGGEKRRLAIASVLAMEPSLIILDEPFSNLDYPGVTQVLNQVVGLNRDGKTLIVITHELEKVLAHATRLLIMDRGRLVCDGRPDEILWRVEEFGVRKPVLTSAGVRGLSWLQ
jgi:biotin transport system ATP-binding protein